MDFLISEQQLKVLLHESNKDNFTDYMKELYSFMSNIFLITKKKYQINLKLLLTWGAAVGGFVMPLDNFIKTGNFNLTESQEALVLIGVAAMVFYDNKRAFEKVYDKIKEEGIEDTFKEVVKKALRLKESFIRFLSSLNVSITSVSELLSYSFLIPIISDIQNAVGTGDYGTAASYIAESSVASGAVLVSTEALTMMLRKILRRIK